MATNQEPDERWGNYYFTWKLEKELEEDSENNPINQVPPYDKFTELVENTIKLVWIWESDGEHGFHDKRAEWSAKITMKNGGCQAECCVEEMYERWCSEVPMTEDDARFIHFLSANCLMENTSWNSPKVMRAIVTKWPVFISYKKYECSYCHGDITDHQAQCYSVST